MSARMLHHSFPDLKNELEDGRIKRASIPASLNEEMPDKRSIADIDSDMKEKGKNNFNFLNCITRILKLIT